MTGCSKDPRVAVRGHDPARTRERENAAVKFAIGGSPRCLLSPPGRTVYSLALCYQSLGLQVALPIRDLEMLVAVVGAGIAGLTSIKNCLEEGFEVVAFEKESSSACALPLSRLVGSPCSYTVCFSSWWTMEV